MNFSHCNGLVLAGNRLRNEGNLRVRRDWSCNTFRYIEIASVVDLETEVVECVVRIAAGNEIGSSFACPSRDRTSIVAAVAVVVAAKNRLGLQL